MLDEGGSLKNSGEDITWPVWSLLKSVKVLENACSSMAGISCPKLLGSPMHETARVEQGTPGAPRLWPVAMMLAWRLLFTRMKLTFEGSLGWGGAITGGLWETDLCNLYFKLTPPFGLPDDNATQNEWEGGLWADGWVPHGAPMAFGKKWTNRIAGHTLTKNWAGQTGFRSNTSQILGENVTKCNNKNLAHIFSTWLGAHSFPDICTILWIKATAPLLYKLFTLFHPYWKMHQSK